MAGTVGDQVSRTGLVLALDAGDFASYPRSGTDWGDLSRNGRTATLVNSPTYTVTGSFLFNGTSQRASLLNVSVAASGNSARSIFAWVKSSVASGRCIVSTGTANTGQAFNLVTYGSNKVGVMGYANDFYPSSGANIFDNRWHFVGATASGTSTVRTYVDSVLDNMGTITYSTAGQNNYIGMSHHSGNEAYWGGEIASVFIYDRQLSASEITQLYNTTRRRLGV